MIRLLENWYFRFFLTIRISFSYRVTRIVQRTESLVLCKFIVNWMNRFGFIGFF